MSGRGRGGRDRSPDFGGDGLLIGVGPGGGGRQGGGLNRGGQQPGAPPKLVLPGRSGPPSGGGGGGRLIIPDKGMEKILSEGAEALGPEVVTLTGPNRYRPPAGFMNEQPDDNSQFASMPPEVMINKLRSRAGKWHQLAKMLPVLAQAHYDSNAIDEVTGITPALQNRWMVAGTVYDSLAASGQLSQDQLERFDQRGDELLLPFRFLNQEMRVEAAEYILELDLDPSECEVLARAMKEWERRPLERAGFSNSPGDCMSFKHLRDALECRRLEDAEVKMELALNTAVTDSARERVFETLTLLRNEVAGGAGVGGGESSSGTGLASLLVLRLDPDELGFRPIPVLGPLGQVAASELETAPRTSQEGAFGAFTIGGQDAACTWVALPQWKALAMMRHPVALSISDCATVPAILAGAKAKTEEDRKRLSGAGLVVADKGETDPDDVDTGSYYLASTGGPGTNAKLSLVEGAKVKERGLHAVATVAFVARPPAREQPVVGSDSLLQL